MLSVLSRGRTLQALSVPSPSALFSLSTVLWCGLGWTFCSLSGCASEEALAPQKHPTAQSGGAENGGSQNAGSESGGSAGENGLGGAESEATASGSAAGDDTPGSFDEDFLSGRACPQKERGFAEEVIASSWGEGEAFGRDDLPGQVLGGPRGGGCCAGSLDVVSLGDGGSITLGFGEREVVDGPGPDFLVFENPFWVGGQSEKGFFELARVEVSLDGKEWLAFPCDPEFPADSSCAGLTPVLANVEKSDIDPFDPEQAGGDAFDLADLGLESARFVRVVDLADDGAVFDLDAVAIVNGRCR